MELCRGDNLLDKLKEQPNKCFTEKIVCGYIRNVLSAVIQGHQGGVIHGDLKLTNCLFLHNIKNSEVLIAGTVHFYRRFKFVSCVGFRKKYVS